MAELPSGTVTMVFSDVEGSTLLLGRLGPAYAEALDGQRRVLREAWAAHDGIEMGTEGDSFFVVFATAPDAVAACVQAQRELAAYPWPGGERVRVRMGMHTGNPTVHDGGYVGMDVHRAARIAGTAHGGQVVISSSTTELVNGALPDGVRLVPLGSHQLKDIPRAEHLFQLTMDGLQTEFSQLKTLGAASSLPRPATPLVGRDGELAELVALLGAPGVRLVTLTGPGGSGKTRLAVGVARGLVEVFPDGVYFVPLATVTTVQVMWTTIAEVLDVPPERRFPPGFFEHVAHRSALFVLDNLEQVPGADGMVAELLEAAPQVVVVATSRRPLHVPEEHEHAVPPLELPADTSVIEVEASGAVQLFVQQARKVKAGFSLSPGNAADVVAVCRRMDGLPLAIELAAARAKLLSPHALLARLDQALDIAATSSRVASRQKTLRDTIGWSYDLLNQQQQAFFRRLGVFAGGADLDAINAVISVQDGADGFELVAELVDASLVTVTEAADGEPRIGMLETVRAYARDQLVASGDLDPVGGRHARHFLQVAEQMSNLLSGDHYAQVRAQFEVEHDNFRAAIAWALQPQRATDADDDDEAIALRLCIALAGFWSAGGYYAEAQRWMQGAVHQAGNYDSAHLARCLASLGDAFILTGDFDQAHKYASESVGMWRRLHDQTRLSGALVVLAKAEVQLGHTAAARSHYEDAVILARNASEQQLLVALRELANLEATEHNYERSLELDRETLTIARAVGGQGNIVLAQHNMACTLRIIGRVEEANEQMRSSTPQIVKINDPHMLVVVAEDYAAILADLGDPRGAVRLLGAADAMRSRIGLPRRVTQEAELAGPIAKTRTALTAQEWTDTYQAGRNTTVENALTEAHAAAAE